MDTTVEFFTLGQLGTALGCQAWHILRLIHRGAVPYTRAGKYHLIHASNVARVREELERAGYLKRPEVVGA